MQNIWDQTTKGFTAYHFGIVLTRNTRSPLGNVLKWIYIYFKRNTLKSKPKYCTDHFRDDTHKKKCQGLKEC